MSSAEEDAREFVTQNWELLTDVLRFSQDTYARACALTLLKWGGTKRDVAAVEADLETVRERVER